MGKSKPSVGTDGGVGSHLTSPNRREARSWTAKTLEIDTDSCQVLDYRTLEMKKSEDSQKFACDMFKQRTI